MSTGRFNDSKLLDAWKRDGRLPKIHDTLGSLVKETAGAGNIMDFCCSTGLLAQRWKTYWPERSIYGVDKNEQSIALAQAYGIEATLKRLVIGVHTLPHFFSMIEHFDCKILTARRCIYEVFGNDFSLAKQFGNDLRTYGIREVFLQGLVDVGLKSRQAMPNLDAEITALGSAWKLSARQGPCAKLVHA